MPVSCGKELQNSAMLRLVTTVTFKSKSIEMLINYNTNCEVINIPLAQADKIFFKFRTLLLAIGNLTIAKKRQEYLRGEAKLPASSEKMLLW
ncbi:Hypothetical predicted protein [Octopus vulgaris]|uniref:Uncharacterized protein n=1 Tax=Octopus vulgaris TaxID=6645 RepID=A0AA36EZR0_OCTVU|nr:Hypothetical predicted protein [Octopus vulgaris]